MLLPVAVIIFTLVACDKPTISFSTPANNSSFVHGEVITIIVEVDDPAEDMKEVRFYANNIGVGSDQSWPYSFDWETGKYGTGNYTIKAEAIDDDGAKSEAEIALIIEDITVTDIEGNVYRTVIIGTQVWMAENLKVTHYRDATPITKVTEDAEWSALTTEGYCIYNDNAKNEVDTYGVLYNWYAAVDAHNIAPEGWHVPTEPEWKELEMTLGMSQIQAEGTIWRGTNQGSKLAGNADLWDDGHLENDSEFGSSGFNALPGGDRDANGAYGFMGYDTHYWSTTVTNSNDAQFRNLVYHHSDILQYSHHKRHGFSIRCLMD